ncbi:hypothetical protein [Puniceicoccus vermicola]|uniref:Uncharacterized protein n=1 Tax=Puniceicoccus vermicola TaxID=388746 RepID=A0A7X1AX38_9BACT|nr:hypothetical protein [Puniceicoccus vermicola]MBC2600628.1 hypothetical protein [Puniceicoccus vermicola]
MKIFLIILPFFFAGWNSVFSLENEPYENVLTSSSLVEFRSEAMRLTIAVSQQGVEKTDLIDVPVVRGIGNIVLSEDEIASIIRVVDEKDMGTIVVIQPLGFSMFWIFSYRSEGKGIDFFILRKYFKNGAQPDHLRFEILDETVTTFSTIAFGT